MALHILCKLRLPSCFPGLCTILLVMCSPLYCSLTKSETITSCNRLLSDLEKPPFALNLTDRTAFCIPNTISPGTVAFEDFSFNVSFNVSIYQKQSQTKNSVALAIHLIPGYYDVTTTYALCPTTRPDPCNYYFPKSSLCVEYLNNKTRTYPAVASKVSTQISVDGTLIILVQIDMDSPQDSSSSVENIYAVTIGYQKMGDSNIWVDVSGDGMRDPVHNTRPWSYDAYAVSRQPISMSMGFFSSMGQLVNIDNWNVETTGVQIITDFGNQQTSSTATILSSVLGSAGAIAVTATVVYIYFNSKYRRWKKEQERLAKIMQGLPGVPTKVEFTDIKKATKNFHDKMKLGKGGFGAVYRCTLPASASRTGQAMEVAVKKFTQEVEDRRFDDFLAEVSIINRLRHKNIVPLVGWSYDKGVPVLVYEYMKNGSLDQHLFQRSGGHNKHDDHRENTPIGEWDTRYGIVRDVATGLHYVHHEHEPMVLHRDIKASNIMLDSTFRARLGDFGIASTVALDRSSVTGVAGTIGYIAPDCVISHKATRQSDIYAFGVLILEIVTGNKSGDVPPDDGHITDWVWRLRQEGKLLEAVDKSLLLATDDERRQHQDTADEAERLLLLGLACANPNPSNRPSMVEVVQIIAKSAPPPELPIERPIFVWPPEDWRARNSIYSTGMSDWESTIELGEVSDELPLSAARTS